MKLKTLYGLPSKVVFCKKSLISNQRPVSAVEFLHTKKTKKRTLNIDKNHISDSWKYSRFKKRINFKKREKQLLKLLEKHRGKHGEFDCIVPSSGGKDSCYAAHLLKYKYGMNPLTVTWPPNLYTSYGLENFKNLLKTGNFSNISANRDEKVMRLLTKLAVINLMHPFQPFMLGQKIFPIRISIKRKIPLIFYGENEAEHGNPISDNNTSLREKYYFTHNNLDKLFIGGKSLKELEEKYKLTINDLKDYIPPNENELSNVPLEVHYLGYYINWIPQETFYYSVENCGFKPRPFRTQGTYSKYNSIDDKMDDLHFYTLFTKFGIGRTTYDVSQEIRNEHLNVEEGKKLIKKYDGEFPSRYFKDILDYLKLKPEFFFKHLEKFRSPHLWIYHKKKWLLRHTVNKDGFND
ncbi:N-acetyl sugar amidotransferase [Pelagibacteraceae bacterium]|nr:N-acetyl sugar amidotransferase [Pelagibacteraceae bacterium]